MAVTQNTYTGNGSTVLYSFTFPYLKESDIKVTVNGSLTTAYSLANATTIQFNTAPANGAAIVIYRETDDDQLKAEFFPGSAIRAQDLNKNFTQTLYVVQEVVARAISKIGDTMQGILNMGGFKITNLGTPATDTDAANKQYIDERLGEIGIPGHTRWTKTATAGQTVLTGTGDEGNTLEYSASREQVFVNGALLQRNIDYTANDGLTITLLVPLILGDLVDVRCVNNLPTGISGLASDITFLQAGTGATSRSVQNKLRDVVSVKDFGAVGDGVADDTAAINAAIAAHAYVYFPPGEYAVTTVNFNRIGARYSGSPSFKGIATTATAAVIEITHRLITFESLAVNQNFNSNYTSAIKWHSPSAGQPAQYVKIKELSINNCIIGILFGQLFGTAVVDAPQSENSITHMSTRGCQTPIYMRQPNGFLYIGESTISSIRNEWEIFNPGVYSYANSRIIVNHQGVLSISNSEVIKTDTQSGLGLELLGGSTNLSNVFVECASRNIDITAGDLKIVNSLLYMSNASESFWRIAQAATGTTYISNTEFLRAAGAANSSRGFIEHGGNTAYRLMGSNCRAINFLNSAFIISALNRPNLIPRYFDLQNFSCQDGDAARADIEIASNQTGRSLLTAKNVDLSGDTTDGWFYVLAYGGGSSFGVIADGPSLSPKDKTLANSLELNATGEAYLRSIDVTSAATAKSTGLTVTQGQTLLVTCWLKRISGIQARVGLAAVTAGGTVSYLNLVSSETDLPVGTWTYLQTVCQVPAGVKYVGIEMRNTVSVSRLSGADLTILN